MRSISSIHILARRNSRVRSQTPGGHHEQTTSFCATSATENAAETPEVQRDDCLRAKEKDSVGRHLVLHLLEKQPEATERRRSGARGSDPDWPQGRGGCSICQEYQLASQKEPIMNHPIPTPPFQNVDTDLFECEGKNYLSLHVYYSRYIEVERFYSTLASFVIMNMKGIFARHGIPQKIVTDNGTQFACTEFAPFAKTWGFVHSTSSSQFPQSSGLAEAEGRIIVKAAVSRINPYIALLENRTPPISDCGKSPAQLLMNRPLRSILPATHRSTPPCVNPAASHLIISHIATPIHI